MSFLELLCVKENGWNGRRLKAFIVSNNLNLLILARELCSFIGRKFFVTLEGKVSLSM